MGDGCAYILNVFYFWGDGEQRIREETIFHMATPLQIRSIDNFISRSQGGFILLDRSALSAHPESSAGSAV